MVHHKRGHDPLCNTGSLSLSSRRNKDMIRKSDKSILSQNNGISVTDANKRSDLQNEFNPLTPMLPRLSHPSLSLYEHILLLPSPPILSSAPSQTGIQYSQLLRPNTPNHEKPIYLSLTGPHYLKPRSCVPLPQTPPCSSSHPSFPSWPL